MGYYRVYFKGVLSRGINVGLPGVVKAVTEAESEIALEALMPGYIKELHIDEIFNPGYVIEKLESTRNEVVEEFPEMENSL